MSILAESADTVIKTIGKGAFNRMLRVAAKPFSSYFKMRLKNKLYKNVPELAIIRKMRQKMFQTDSTTISSD
jgi:hypothetical protein